MKIDLDNIDRAIAGFMHRWGMLALRWPVAFASAALVIDGAARKLDTKAV